MVARQIETEAEWHDFRSRNIGGSEIACLFYQWVVSDGTERVFHIGEVPSDGGIVASCLSPHKTGFRLLQERRGRLMPDDLNDNDRVIAGKHLEPAIAEWSKSKFGWNIRKVRRYIEHDSVPGWGASLDYEIHEKNAAGAPVEFKNVDFLIFRDQWQTVGDEIIMPPMHIVLQLQHQIGAANADHGWIVVCVGGNRLYRFRMDRHEATQKRISAAVAAFWDLVSGDGDPVWIADAGTAADLYTDTGVDRIVDLTNDEKSAFDARRITRWRKHRAAIDKRIEFMEGALMASMKNATKAKLAGFRISWPLIERPAKMVPARWQDELVYRGRFQITPNKGE